MQKNQENSIPNQVGIHYFQDTDHYRQEDLKIWLPKLKELNVGWLVLKSEKNRAIPEEFLESLIQESITPIIEFNLPIQKNYGTRELKLLLQVYARWGIKYCIFYDRPNQKQSWPDNYWAQNDLVDRFLDQYIPLAKYAILEGLIPVFPPLEPGGNYWDTAFLRSCLKNLESRDQSQILDNLVLSAYAYTFKNDLNWGIGGPEFWPQSKPYITPPNSQDQKGFRIYEWYEAIANSVLQKEVPILLLQAGLTYNPTSTKFSEEELKQNWSDQKIISLLLHTQESITAESGDLYQPVPSSVLACNFWLLASDEESQRSDVAWYLNGKVQNPFVNELIESFKEEKKQKAFTEKAIKSKRSDPKQCLISHYVLLPGREYGISDEEFDQIKPLVNKGKATVGFSVDEAILSNKVTLIANQKDYSEETIQKLQKFGCIIEQISHDGTIIATL